MKHHKARIRKKQNEIMVNYYFKNNLIEEQSILSSGFNINFPEVFWSRKYELDPIISEFSFVYRVAPPEEWPLIVEFSGVASGRLVLK